MKVTNELGIHPMAALFNFIKKAFLTSIILIGVTFLISTGAAAVVGLILFVLWCIYGLTLPAFLMAGWGSAKYFNATKKAVEAGGIDISYASTCLAGAGIIVVDEKNQKLCINGDVIPFSEVKTINKYDSHITFNLKSGANPFRDVGMSNSAEASNFYQRMANSMGFE